MNKHWIITGSMATPSHSFSPVPGFLIDTHSPPIHTMFALIDDAARWCSISAACRAFSVSVLHMQVSAYHAHYNAAPQEWHTCCSSLGSCAQDDRLHFVRFFSHTVAVLSGDWMSYIKEAAMQYSYHFDPGYLIQYRGTEYVATSLSAADNVPLLKQRCSLVEAHRYCDAEPTCSGFTLARPDSQTNDTDKTTAEEAWVTFSGGAGRRVLTVYDGTHISYVKGAALPPLPAHGMATAPAAGKGVEMAQSASEPFLLQYGYLGGDTPPLSQARLSLAAGMQWCSRHPSCGGFTLAHPPDREVDAEGGAARWLTFWESVAVTQRHGWVSFVKPRLGGLSPVLQWPGYLAHPAVLHEATMGIDEARQWCDRASDCAGFTLNVAVPPNAISSRTDAENVRAHVRFSSSTEMIYTDASTGWVSYTKQRRGPEGSAANAAAAAGSILSWLQQPGFIVGTAEIETDQACTRI